MNATHRALTALIAAAATSGLGCGSEGTGTVEVTTYGEDYIEQQIPAASGGGEGFVDGWSVSFSKFLLALGALQIADRSGAVGAELQQQKIYDLHAKGPHPILSATVAARRWDRVGVSILKAKGAVAGNAAAADVALMNDHGHSVYVAGEAENGSRKIRFAWGFATETSYRECHEATTGDGVAVPTGGVAAIQITIHGDHLFYDDLQSEDPSLRFEALAAADANADGEVTLDELAAVDLTTLPSDQYGTGGDGSVTSLAGFVTSLTRTLVHYQGEGHCQSGAPAR